MTIEQDNHVLQKYYMCLCNNHTRPTCTSFLFDEGEQINTQEICKRLFKNMSTERIYFAFEVDVVSYMHKIDRFQNVVKEFCKMECNCIADMYSNTTNRRIGILLLDNGAYCTAIENLLKYPQSAAIFIGSPNDEREFLKKVLQSVNICKTRGVMRNNCKVLAAYGLSTIHCICGSDGYSVNYISFSSTDLLLKVKPEIDKI